MEPGYSNYRQFQWTFTPLTGPSMQQKKPVCSSLMFRNAGTAMAWIDEIFPLYPGEVVQFDGYPGEINIHSYSINWTGTGTQLVIMAAKEYPAH